MFCYKQDPIFCRSLEEVELNLGGICLHVYPHQIHILSEIAGAVSVMADPTSQHHAVLTKTCIFQRKGVSFKFSK